MGPMETIRSRSQEVWNMTLLLQSPGLAKREQDFSVQRARIDIAQVVYSALVRADPQRFKPIGVGAEKAARTWSLWTDELGTIKNYAPWPCGVSGLL